MHQPRHLFGIGSRPISLLVCVVGGMYLTPLAKAQQTLSKPSTMTSLNDTATFYQPNQVHVIHLQVHDSDLDKMKLALPQRIYVPATFRLANQTIDNVGVRYKGNSSSNPRQRHKRSFLI